MSIEWSLHKVYVFLVRIGNIRTDIDMGLVCENVSIINFFELSGMPHIKMYKFEC